MRMDGDVCLEARFVGAVGGNFSGEPVQRS
jgi:hypothetical protein